MKISILLPLLSCMLLVGSSWAHQELMEVLKQQQKELDLSSEEVNALHPFFAELQKQHNYIHSLMMQEGDGSAQKMKQSTPFQLDESFAKAFKELRAQFIKEESYKPTIEYDAKLPSLEQMIGEPSLGNMTEQELLEFQDLLAVLQDVIDESELGINELVQRAIDMEINLLKLNKPKIVTAAIAGLEVMWNYWGRAARAAYCSYSHVPQFTEALHAINDGVDCYSYAMQLILQIQHETVASVKEIKHQVMGLVNIYKKISAKKTLVGKIISGVTNALSALRRVHDIIAVGIAGYDKINNQLPGAVNHTAQCGLDFVNSIPQMVETAENVTICIVYTDPDKPYYDFTEPEDDRYWNTGKPPVDIPHENETDWDDDDVDGIDDDEDDYIDHR